MWAGLMPPWEYKISAIGGKPTGGTTIGIYDVVFDKTILDTSNPRREIITQLLPRKYVNPATSGFRVEVKKGKNVFDFDLVGK